MMLLGATATKYGLEVMALNGCVVGTRLSIGHRERKKMRFQKQMDYLSWGALPHISVHLTTPGHGRLWHCIHYE